MTEMTLPTTEQQLQALVSTLQLYSVADGYRVRLERANRLNGKLKLAVLRQVLRRMLRYGERINDDLTARLAVAEMVQNTTEDALLRGHAALTVQRLEQMQSVWNRSIEKPYEASLAALEEIFTPFEV